MDNETCESSDAISAISWPIWQKGCEILVSVF